MGAATATRQALDTESLLFIEPMFVILPVRPVIWKTNERGLDCSCTWHASRAFTIIYVRLPAGHEWFGKSNVHIMRDALRRLAERNGISNMDNVINSLHNFMVHTIFARVFGFGVSYSNSITGVVGTDTMRKSLVTEAMSTGAKEAGFTLVSRRVTDDFLDVLLDYPSVGDGERAQLMMRQIQNVTNAWRVLMNTHVSSAAEEEAILAIVLDLDSL